jgi:acyl-CoA synthetase (AMP-forming)/AMP-acid ligase II
MRTLGEIPKRNAKLFPDREAIVFEDTWLTWKRFNDRVNRLANWLLAQGAKKGDTVSALAMNCHQYYELYYAAFKIGMINAPINYRLSPQEMLYLINHSEAKIFFVGAEYFDYVEQYKDKFEFAKIFISFDGPRQGMEDYDKILKDSSPEEPDIEVDENEVAVISYTGGTTGLPKGALLTHRNFLTVINTIGVQAKFTEVVRTLQVLPPFHLTIWQTLVAHFMGGTSVLNKKLDLHHVMSLFAKEKINWINLVPVLLNWIVNDPDSDKYDFSSLKYITYGGSPIPDEVLKTCIEKLDANLVQGFGLTESTLLATFLEEEYHVISDDPKMQRRLKSVGREAWHNEVKVVDETGNEVPTGVVGEIIIKGPNVMRGYWKDPEQTAKRIRNGWLYSNDMGYFDEDLFLYIVDRKEFMIITGGENVYPKEVENVVYQHPAVNEAAVVSAPDKKWGEAVTAVIVLKEGKKITAEELISFCKERLAGYKCPRIVKFVDSLPKTPIMKIDVKKVRDELWKGYDRKIT